MNVLLLLGLRLLLVVVQSFVFSSPAPSSPSHLLTLQYNLQSMIQSTHHPPSRTVQSTKYKNNESNNESSCTTNFWNRSIYALEYSTYFCFLLYVFFSTRTVYVRSSSTKSSLLTSYAPTWNDALHSEWAELKLTFMMENLEFPIFW